VALKHKHRHELESDAADMVWSLFGSAVHGILEQGADDDHILEERLYASLGGGLSPEPSTFNGSAMMAWTFWITRLSKPILP